MKSPFPGMDPYVEEFWNDVHFSFLGGIRRDLNAALPPRYRATIQDRVMIADQDDPVPGERYPDVTVIEWPAARPGGTATATRSQKLVVQSPALLTYAGEPVHEYSLEIVDSKFGHKVVTAVEVLSPTNKRPGSGMTAFRRKQEEYRTGHINRVEIDLLRDGRRMFEFPERLLTADQRKPYYVIVHRGERDRQAEIYAIDLREPLPVIGIPLRPGELDVPVDLQPIMEAAADENRFPIDYDEPCLPALTGDDAAWATDLLARRPR